MPTKKSATPPLIYQLKVTLRGSRPPIWRRLQVSASTSLSRLHDILQVSMGWTNSHLHQFAVGPLFYSDPSFDLDDALNEQRVTLHQLHLQPKMRVAYEYDMGDDWQHDILIEKIEPPEPGIVYPRCLTGKRACPPEDCGGIYGYYGLLEAVQDPHHPDHDDILAWLVPDFKPDAFDLQSINSQLQALK